MSEGAAERPGSHFPPARRRFAVPAIATSSVVLAVLGFGVGARDDSYITFWEAEQLAKTGRLVNINGVHIEQSTSLAHVIVLAVLYFITRAPLPVLGYLVGLAGLWVTVWLAARLARRVSPRAELPAAIVVALAFPIVYWATGELETDLASVAVLWFLLALDTLAGEERPRRRTVLNYLGSAVLLVTVRPDTMLAGLLIAFVVGVLAVGAPVLPAGMADRLPRFARRGSVVALGAVVAAALVLALFREIYFGAVLPQADLAKSGGFGWIARGFSYEFSSLPYWLWLVILVPGVTGLTWCVRHRSRAGYLAGCGFAGGALVLLFSRGDWMGGARLLVPYLPPLLVAVGVGAAWAGARWRWAVVVAVVGVECTALVLFANGAGWLSSQFTTLAPSVAGATTAAFGSSFGGSWTEEGGAHPSIPWYSAWDAVSTRDALFLDAATPQLRALISALPAGTKITIGSNQAGMVIYNWANEFPGRITFIDTQSVTTNDFATCPGRRASYAGDLITLPQWAADAGGCAPPLPDLFFSLNQPAKTPGVSAYYHVIAEIVETYTRHGIGASVKKPGVEFLAERDGWSP